MLDVLFSAGRFEPNWRWCSRTGWPACPRRWPRRPLTCRSMSRRAPVMDAIAGFPCIAAYWRSGKARQTKPAMRLLAALPRQRAGHRAGRHLQPRQYGRDLPQRRRLRRRRRAARRDLLRPALPQGDPRLGRRRAEGPFAICGPDDDLADALDAHGFSQFALSPGGTGRYPRRPSAANGWRSISGPKAKACPQAAGALDNGAHSDGAGFDSLNVAAASAIALHEIRNRSELR